MKKGKFVTCSLVAMVAVGFIKATIKYCNRIRDDFEYEYGENDSSYFGREKLGRMGRRLYTTAPLSELLNNSR